MANALKTIRHVYDRIRGQGIRETFIKARDQGFISSLLDGNLFEQKVLKGEGRLVGEDKVGNKVGLPSSNSLHILHENFLQREYAMSVEDFRGSFCSWIQLCGLQLSSDRRLAKTVGCFVGFCCCA